MMNVARWMPVWVLAMVLHSVMSNVHAEQMYGCGELEGGHYGPYDYRTELRSRLKLVESNHFDARVEGLRSGITSSIPGGDLSYTLHAFPNHHRALMTMVRYGQKMKTDRPPGSAYSVACWLDRAERFRPDDPMVQTIFGIYLVSRGRADDAVVKFQNALSMAGDSPNIHYNLGLAFFDLGQFESALNSAHTAYALGFPLPGLRDKLKRIGKWKDPAPAMTDVVEQGNSAESQGRSIKSRPREFGQGDK